MDFWEAELSLDFDECFADWIDCGGAGVALDFDDRSISCSSRLKAFSPSPYISGMKTSKIPRRQYALSSSRVILRLLAHDILSETLKLDHFAPRRASTAIPVIEWISDSKDRLSQSMVPSREKNSTEFMATIHKSVYSRQKYESSSYREKGLLSHSLNIRNREGG